MAKQPEQFKKLDPTRKGFNYEFRMLLEGTQVPFRSANIVCTPNGVEASINIPYHHSVYDLKPKTAVQLFYREWWGKNPEWKLMFDGFFARYDTNSDVMANRGVSITCRDFRMDIRKAPAAIVLEPSDPGKALGVRTTLTREGIWQTNALPGINGQYGVRTYTMGDQGLNPLNHVIEQIAGMAAGQGVQPDPKNAGELTYSNLANATWSINGLKKQYMADGKFTELRDAAEKAMDGAFFLDGFIRGLWLEATGSINIASFMNKRLRVDKRIMVMPNMAGFTMFKRHNFGLMVGNLILGNSMFTSIEAVIMRLAGLFMSHVYSCNTPSLISLDNSSPAVRKVMHESVRNFLVDRVGAEFGPKYLLNETMLLPPLHFTAPPNCNIFLPPMYDSIRFQFDHDSDYTRGYYRISETISTPRSSGLGMGSVQFPNALFSKDTKESDSKNSPQTKTPRITIEERYKGINVIEGSVNYGMAQADISKTVLETYFNTKKLKQLRDRIDKLSKEIDKNATNKFNTESFKDELLKLNIPESRVDEMIKAIDDQKRLNELKKTTEVSDKATVTNAMNKHAVVQFVNAKFMGRVANVDMAFNPFVIGGFPGLIVTDSDERSEAGKPIIGFVQQIKHFIVITSDGGEASTSVVLSNARYVDESTDFDIKGMPLYMKPTDKDLALATEKLEYQAADYLPPTGTPHDDFENDYESPYDVKESSEKDYVYARDLITLSQDAIKNGELTRIYIDQDYAPNHISRYYRDVFGQTHHLMVGNTTFLGKPAQFIYDTIHEAVVSLMRTRPDLLTSYEACLEYVHRNVCSADAFYQGILGLSVKREMETVFSKKAVVYVHKDDGYDGTKLEDEYFGITTVDYELNSRFITDERFASGGTLNKAGRFSSIREVVPKTAFIQERRDAVHNYLDNINRIGEAMFFATGE